MDKVIARCILALIIHREETSQRALFDQERKKAAFECDSYQKWLFLLPLLRLWALMPCFHLRLVSLVRTPQLPDEPWGSSFSPFVWLPPSRRVKGKLLNKLRRNWMNYGRAWFTTHPPTPPRASVCESFCVLVKFRAQLHSDVSAELVATIVLGSFCSIGSCAFVWRGGGGGGYWGVGRALIM